MRERWRRFLPEVAVDNLFNVIPDLQQERKR